jgi:glycosyltransferase involved in cell wall biosynthesis
VRAELGLSDRLLVTYCGSLAPWQLPVESLRIFQLLKASNPKAHFLAITTEKERMAAVLARYAVAPGDATIISVTPNHVARYLAAGDIGLLLRESSLVNRVASPVKFAEYMAGGLPVVISEGVGDYSELTRRESTGLVISDDLNDPTLAARLRDFERSYTSDPASWRARCHSVAVTRLDHGNWRRTVHALYDRLTEDIVRCDGRLRQVLSTATS